MVSSFAPPHLPAPIPAVDHLDDHQLTALLSDLGGIPPELTEWPALRDNAVAAARIDLRLCTTDEEAEPVALSCPIHAFGGSDDPLVTESDLHEWRSRTTGEFSCTSCGAATSISVTGRNCSPHCCPCCPDSRP